MFDATIPLVLIFFRCLGTSNILSLGGLDDPVESYVEKEDYSIKIGAIMGLGLAYAGSQNEQVRGILMPVLAEGKTPLDFVAFTAISIGLVFVGSCNEDVAHAIIFVLMDRSKSDLADPLAHFLPLGLGLLYLGKQDSVEATAEVSKTFMKKLGNIVT
ncbi:hypothetical protein ACS0TY_022386 [Phlomoides rotata]